MSGTTKRWPIHSHECTIRGVTREGAPTTGFLDSYLPYQLRRADQAVSAGLYKLLAEQDVARSEWRVLAVLVDLGELSMLELTAASLSPQPTVTHAVRRLEARGMVQRTPGVEDRRQRFVAITPAGRKLTENLISEATRLEAAALAGFDNRNELSAELRRLASMVEAAGSQPTTPAPSTPEQPEPQEAR